MFDNVAVWVRTKEEMAAPARHVAAEKGLPTADAGADGEDDDRDVRAVARVCTEASSSRRTRPPPLSCSRTGAVAHVVYAAASGGGAPLTRLGGWAYVCCLLFCLGVFRSCYCRHCRPPLPFLSHTRRAAPPAPVLRRRLARQRSETCSSSAA